tara:strand:- start:3200 stop:5074 length:1875 start_codon:yes stop_codon:yes gene_type:complete
MHDQIVQIAWIAFFAILAQWLGWRLKTPAIVFFLIFGFIAGPILSLVHPEILIGDLLQPLTSIAVGIILFEGSLNLNFKEIVNSRTAIRHFVIVGAPVAWVLTSLSAYYLAGLSLEVAVTFGALLIVTGPTVIMPLLKNARLVERPASILKWEGLINDPIGAVLAVLCYEYFILHSGEGFQATGFFSGIVLKVILITALSFVIGRVIGTIFNRGLIPEYMKSAALLSLVVIFYVICNEILHESGLIGVTVLGITLANMGLTSLEEIKKFKETMSLMLVSGIFIILTAQMDPAILLNIDWRGVLFIASILFVIRPITALLSSIGTEMTWKEIVLTGWVAPRGIVAAAIAGIMGPLLIAAGYEDGAQMLPLAFAIVLVTVFMHGLSAKPLAKWLNLSYPERDALIVVGASAWSIQLAQTLQGRGIDVLIADKNWYALKQARLGNIPTYYGEILSEETEYNVELTKYNVLLSVTNNPAYNSLVCSAYAHDFSRESTYQFLPHEEDEHERRQITETIRGEDFGSEDLDYWILSNYYNKGWRFKAARIGKAENIDKIEVRVKKETLKVIGYIKSTHTLKRKLYLRRPKNLKDLKEEDVLITFEKIDEQGENAASNDRKRAAAAKKKKAD